MVVRSIENCDKVVKRVEDILEKNGISTKAPQPAAATTVPADDEDDDAVASSLPTALRAPRVRHLRWELSFVFQYFRLMFQVEDISICVWCLLRVVHVYAPVAFASICCSLLRPNSENNLH